MRERVPRARDAPMSLCPRAALVAILTGTLPAAAQLHPPVDRVTAPAGRSAERDVEGFRPANCEALAAPPRSLHHPPCGQRTRLR